MTWNWITRLFLDGETGSVTEQDQREASSAAKQDLQG